MTRAAHAALSCAFVFVCGCSSCREEHATPAAKIDAAASASATAEGAPPPFSNDAGSGWQGEIELSLIAPPRVDLVAHLAIKGDRIRYASPNKIARRDATTIVDVGLRRLVVLPKDGVTYQRVELPANPVDAGAMTLTLTGKKATVNGIDCAMWEGKDGGVKSEACIAEGIAFVDSTMIFNAPPPPAWLRALNVGKRFPVSVTVRDATGKITFVLKASGVNPHPMGDADFVVPLGVHESEEKIPGSPWKPGLPM